MLRSDTKTESKDNVNEEKQDHIVRNKMGEVETGDGLKENTGVVTIPEGEEVVIRRTKTVTVKVPLRVNTCEVKAVVDTGASVTVLSDKVFNAIPATYKPQLREVELSLRVAEENKKMTTMGMADVEMTIGDQCFTWPVYIAPIGDDMLLGCDVIDEKDITVNTRSKGAIEIGGSWVKCDIERVKDLTCRVRVSETVIIPASSEVLINGIPENQEVLDTRYSILEPVFEDHRDILPARSLVDPYQTKVPVRFINLSRTHVKLKKGYLIGELHPIESIQCMEQSSKSNNTLDEKIPEHLEELYDRSCKNIEGIDLKNRLAALLIKHKDAFARNKTDLGKCSIVKHKINIEDSVPIRQPLRRTPKGFEGEEEQHLYEQLDSGVIQPSESAWASPVVLVRKKDNTVRWCIDYRKLNNATKKDAYPLPRIDTCLDCLSTAKVFSTLDLQSGYWQLEIAEEDRHKTAFITKYGLFEYRKMPFGLCNAPSTFQRCMELILKGLQWKTLLIYLDDVIIYSSDVQTHLDQLDIVLTRLHTAGLKLKPSKCDLIKSSVLYLGHVVSKDGLQPNPKITESITSWKVPKDMKETQRFIGLCNYYRRFIKDFSKIAAPLHKLTHKNTTFVWTDEAQKAFEMLKSSLVSSPILGYPCEEGLYVLDTDASNIGVGGVLSQVQDGQERVLSYASKKLDTHQVRYSTTRKELLAVITFITQFRHYLLGKKFLLRTDHGSLAWLFSFKDQQGQIARWLEVLAQYNFDIQHRDGNKHLNADALSRKPTSDFDESEWTNFKENVDDVTELGNTVRVVTRSQSRKPMVTCSWIEGHSVQDIAEMQRKDNVLKILHQWMDQGVTPNRDDVTSRSAEIRKYWINWPTIERINDVLYLRRISHNDSGDTYLLLVPGKLKTDVLRIFHSNVMAGHFGVTKTTNKIKEKFYWYRMREDIRNYISTCNQCNKAKSLKPKPQATLKSYLAGNPMDRIAMDILGPLPKTKQGNKYILVIGDHFTRWMEAYPIPEQTSKIIAEKLVKEFMARFGIPLEVHSDQGKNFDCKLINDICRLLEVRKTRSTAYHPESNGLIERFNQTLGRMIRTHVKETQDWDQDIALLLAAYRSTKHPATGFSPNYLMLGREVLSPLEIQFPLPKSVNEDENHRDQNQYAIDLHLRLHKVYEEARDNLKRAAERQKRDHDTRASEHSHPVGSLVYKYNNIHHKFESPWSGPFLVVRKYSSSVYKIRGKHKSEVIHHDRLKPFMGGEIPTWVGKLKTAMHTEGRD